MMSMACMICKQKPLQWFNHRKGFLFTEHWHYSYRNALMISMLDA